MSRPIPDRGLQYGSHRRGVGDFRRCPADARKRVGEAGRGGHPRRGGKSGRATLRATQSLILARTGEGPATTAVASDGLDALARLDSRCETLKARYYSRIYHLHAQCFYNGRCASPEIRRRIIETADYIRDAEALAYE